MCLLITIYLTRLWIIKPDVITDFNLTSGLIREAIKGLNLNSTLPNKVFFFFILSVGLGVKFYSLLDSREAGARFLNLQSII